MVSTISTFVDDDTKLGRNKGNLSRRAGLLCRRHQRSGKMVNRNIMNFNRDKLKVQHLGSNSWPNKLESSFAEKRHGSPSKGSEQETSVSPAAKAKHILGHISKSLANRLTEAIILLYSALVKPHLEFCIQSGAHQCKRNIDIPKQVQQRATKMVTGLEYMM